MNPAHRSERLSPVRGFVLIAALAAWAAAYGQENPEPVDSQAAVKLGERLFHDLRLSNPGARFDASCRSCHIPPDAPEVARNYTDVVPLSLLPSSARGMKRTAKRNTPTLVDAHRAERFYWDGRYATLEDAVVGELVSPHLGWLPDERDYALDEFYNTVAWDTGAQVPDSVPYPDEFRAAFDADVQAMERDAVVRLAAKALATFIRALESDRLSPYDAFVAANGLPEQRDEARDETVKGFARRFLDQLATREAADTLVFPGGFGERALEGLKIFFQADGAVGAGHCVSCHPPPLFTDYRFHNTGITQAAYDGLHGPGSFVALKLPDASERPVPNLMQPPAADDPNRADLGYWNYAPAGDGLEHTVAAFRTPGLRDLALSDPYMHNGAYAGLEEALRQKIEAANLARAGQLRNVPPAMAAIRIDEGDIAPLTAFLEALNGAAPK